MKKTLVALCLGFYSCAPSPTNQPEQKYIPESKYGFPQEKIEYTTEIYPRLEKGDTFIFMVPGKKSSEPSP